MSPAQFALAVGAPSKWINNTRRILGVPPTLDAAQARWLAIVHELHTALECSLARAAHIANVAVAASPHQRELRISIGPANTAELVIDLWRANTMHLARLSLALTRPPVEQRGRPTSAPKRRQRARTRAIAYGVDISRLREGLGRSVHERLVRLDENAAFLAAGRASLARKRNVR